MHSFWSFFPNALLPLGGLPSEECFPSFFVCDFTVAEEERVPAPRLLESWRKLQAFPFVHFPFTFRWKHSSCFLSSLTDFPSLLLFAGVPVTVVSLLASKISGSHLLNRRISSVWFLASGSSDVYSSVHELVHTMPTQF